MKTKRRVKLAVFATIAAAALVGGTAVPAAAASYNINASLNCAGALFTGTTYRYHSSGSASIRLTKHNWWYDVWSLRTGLRNLNGTQVTQSLQFKPTSRATHTYRTTSGSTTIPSGRYAVNARVGGTENTSGCRVFPPTFEAVLTL